MRPEGDVRPKPAIRASRFTWKRAIAPLIAESLPPAVTRLWFS